MDLPILPNIITEFAGETRSFVDDVSGDLHLAFFNGPPGGDTMGWGPSKLITVVIPGAVITNLAEL